MNSLPQLMSTAVLVGVIAIIGIDFVAIFLAYRQLTKRLKAIEAERDDLKKNIEQNAASVLEDARKQAMVVLERAQDKAQQILTDTKQFQLDAKRIFEAQVNEVATTQSQELQKASQELLQNYEASLAKLKNDDINLFKTITETIEKDVTADMNEFKNVLERETLSSQKMIEDKLEQQYTQVRGEIDEYKKQQLIKVDEHILELLEQVSMLTMQKSLSLQDHEELIVEALQAAKKEV